MAKNRYRQKAKVRRQYTLTGTKAFAAFWLSIFFSLILDSYFDRYGPRVIAQIKDLMTGTATAVANTTVDPAGAAGNPQLLQGAQQAPVRSAFDPKFRERLNQLDRPSQQLQPTPLQPAPNPS